MIKMKHVFLLFVILFFGIEAQSQTTESSKKLVPTISKEDHTEFSPTISADGRTFVYETQRGEKWQLYQSNQNEAGEWSEPAPLTAINEKCEFIAGPSLSYDGNTLFYTAFIEGVTKSEDIFYSVRLGEREWSEPMNIGSPINTDDEYEGFPSISSNGNSLYFVKLNTENDFHKKAKEPCFKIFVSHKQADGTWGTPLALPVEINSGCERDPKIMADNRTLIFSSIRPEGKGKYDLYQTKLKNDNTWDIATPLDFINSPENDQAPCISASGSKMYYYSSNDIYEVAIPAEYRQMINVTVQGKIQSKQSKLPLEAAIQVKNLDGEIFESKSNDSDGRYSLVLAAGKKYEIVITHPDFVGEILQLDFSDQKKYLQQDIDILLSDSVRLEMSAEDKDLHNPVKAFFLRIAEKNGSVVFADSVFQKDYPKTVMLKAKPEYIIDVSAPGYTSAKTETRLGSLNLKQIVKVQLLEHEKIMVAADVTDISTGERKRMKVTYSNQNTDEVIIANAGDVVNLRKGDRYQVVTNSDKGYAYTMKTLTAGEGSITADGKQAVDLSVAALNVGSKLTLNHIYFGSNSWELDEHSALELKSIIELMKRNPGLRIEISAHTDNVGTDEYNLELSQKRAISVTKYLNGNGISVDRLVAKGYGKSQPFTDNETEENRARNRRVELLVLKVD
jgi:outer membrane protein OmpA-like peptidoglycan-associated protein/Tol biopolymer transport system component